MPGGLGVSAPLPEIWVFKGLRDQGGVATFAALIVSQNCLLLLYPETEIVVMGIGRLG
jgi:hypothetical protein